MARIIIPSVLRSFTDRKSELTYPGATVGEIVTELTEAYPDLAPHILDKGQLRSFVNLYVDNTDIRSLQGVDTPVTDGSTVLIIPSIAGGSEQGTHNPLVPGIIPSIVGGSEPQTFTVRVQGFSPSINISQGR